MELLDSGEDTVVQQSGEPSLEPEKLVQADDAMSSRPTEHGHSLTQTIAVIVTGIVLVVLLVLLGRWIYHRAHHSPVLTPANSKQLPAPPAGSSGGNSSSKSQGSNSKNSNSASSSTSQTSSLPNSGPGNVPLIFAGASLAAAGLHFIISLRMQAREES